MARTNLSDSFARNPAPTGSSKPRIIQRSTFEYVRPDGTKVVRYHDTDILFFHPDGRFTLNSGGFRTSTTKERMNKHSPARIYSDKGEWYVSLDGKTVRFYDGMTFPDALDDENEERFTERDKRKKEIAKFVKTLDSEIPPPNNGDCWLCRSNSTDCLRSHVDEKYMHGSLIIAAMRAAGRTDYAIRLFAFSDNPDVSIVKRDVRRYLQHHVLD